MHCFTSKFWSHITNDTDTGFSNAHRQTGFSSSTPPNLMVIPEKKDSTDHKAMSMNVWPDWAAWYTDSPAKPAPLHRWSWGSGPWGSPTPGRGQISGPGTGEHPQTQTWADSCPSEHALTPHPVTEETLYIIRKTNQIVLVKNTVPYSSNIYLFTYSNVPCCEKVLRNLTAHKIVYLNLYIIPPRPLWGSPSLDGWDCFYFRWLCILYLPFS